MQKWLLIIFLFLSDDLFAQRGMLFVKKRGLKKVRTFVEGDHIRFYKSNGDYIQGIIALVKNDSLYIGDNVHQSSSIKKIILRDKDKTLPKDIAFTTLAVAGASVFFSFSKEETFGSASARLGIVGYGQILIKRIFKIKRKKYRIGKKFSVSTLDLHF